MQKLHALIFVVPLLAGCVHFPQSPESFRTQAAGSHSFVRNTSLEGAYELVAKNTIRCHQGDTSQMSMVGGSFFVFPTGSTRVEGKIDEASGTATVSVNYFNPTGSGLLQVIDFKRVDQASTNILIYRLNDTKKWTTATRYVENWFAGSQECYDMW